jgi:DNA polymerase III subunit gamma/tau
MAEYQVIARKYRPKTFKEVVGQEPIVKTLKNALKFNRLAHAYLFSGSRGTGKTTLARIFAKSLNCEHLDSDGEPCSKCSSCLEIAAGTSIDVLEIDGASHRGIDDIRVISDSVGYAPSRGRFKIYIIDEVHMLTKEAFNALLKTLEEPPAKVKFLFATTEPHKLPQTILSRCQRFNLKRFPLSLIMKKLEYISQDLKVEVENGVFNRIAEFAEGGLRDAESLFDQILSFSDGKVSLDIVNEILGVLPRTWFLELDRAFTENDYSACFRIAEEVFLQGKDLNHFLEDLTTHYRSLLLLKLTPHHPLPELDSAYRDGLKASQIAYTQEQCLAILDKIIETRSTIKGTISEKIALETLLLNIVREKNRLSIAAVTKRLYDLEKAMVSFKPEAKETVKSPQPQIAAAPVAAPVATPVPVQQAEQVKVEQVLVESPSIKPAQQKAAPEKPLANTPVQAPLAHQVATPKPEAPAKPKKESQAKPQILEEPKPVPIQSQIFPETQDARLEILPALAQKAKEAAPIQASIQPQAQNSAQIATTTDDMQEKSRYDTLIQFAAVELGGTVQRTDVRSK